jgi:hypothetical protein
MNHAVYGGRIRLGKGASTSRGGAARRC